MSATTRQHLPPCCHGAVLPRKDTPKVRFKSELAKYAVASAAKDALPRLADALTTTRSALQLDRSGSNAAGSATTGSQFQTLDAIQAHIGAVVEYLSLVRGFTVAPASLVSDAQPPLVAAPMAVPSPVATLDAGAAASGGSGSPLRQPLLDPAATGVDLGPSRSKCLSFCSWRDVLSNGSAYAPNARVETAQALLASGLLLLQDARVRVDAMLAERVTELPENELKMAYQLLLHAAGVFDACLRALDVAPCAIGADASDLSATPAANGSATNATATEEPSGDDAAALEQWRQEQRRASQPLPAAATTTATASAPSAPPLADGRRGDDDDFALLSRLPDLANGRFPQLLAWVALAQAQELVVLRGVSRDFVDYTLMAKLSVDVAQRYGEAQAFAARHLPCASSAVAERLQLYCAFKQAYYTAVSCYFQGAACMEKDDARHCAQAIADLKKAGKLIQEANQRKAQYDAKAPKDERDRLFAIKTVYVRAEQIIQRDLEIVTRRNDSIYYERIPEPEPQSEPISLVRAVEFPPVEVHALWHDADINTCIQATNPRAAAAASGQTSGSRPAASAAAAGHTQEGGPRKDGCCDSCVIS